MLFHLFAKQSASATFPEDWKCKDTYVLSLLGSEEIEIKANERYCFSPSVGAAFFFGKDLKIEAKKIKEDLSVGDDIGTEENSFGLRITDLLGAVVAVSSKTDQKILAFGITVLPSTSNACYFDTFTGVTRKFGYKISTTGTELPIIPYYQNFNPKGVKVSIKKGAVAGVTGDKEYSSLILPGLMPSITPGSLEASATIEIAKAERDERVPEIYMKFADDQKVFKSTDAGDSVSKSDSSSTKKGSSFGVGPIIGIVCGVVAVAALVIGIVLFARHKKTQEDTTGMVKMI